ncbi:hypothetical protein H6P81_019097 [Aristolochia fimbriata]|uniref:Uncharacterized protein n=1 Tax=Aristolochia fimbriata TaxID=158543 RepID=A0AAV7DTY7_ARIFI|nr:hypothetical protein H6P81_019097 [Aristolochia fimbriata]
MSKVQQYTGSHYSALPVETHYSVRKEGKVDTLFISAEALNIVWGNDKRYWQWRPLHEKQGFKLEVAGAELQQVNWIQVNGRLDCSKISNFFSSTRSKTRYEILWVMKFNADAFGWQTAPIKFKVASDGKQEQRSEKLETYRKKSNQWHEIKGGDFTINNANARKGLVHFGMYETESDWWKGSMVLAGVKIRPKV